MNLNELRTLIGKIGKAAMKFAAQVQVAAVECLIHAVRHGDVSLANSLIEAVGKGTRKATLYAWFEVNGPFYLPKGKTALAFDRERADKLAAEGEDALRARLIAVQWTEAKPEAKPVSVFDVSVEFDKFLNRMNKLAKEPEVQIKHKELLGALEAFQAKAQADEILKSVSQLEPAELARVYGLARVPQA